MSNNRSRYIKNLLLPCLAFSTLTGVVTALLVFIFKALASAAISLSSTIYAAVRTEPSRLWFAVVGAALIGAVLALVLLKAPDCRGGGIPTAVAVLRGLVPFEWIKSVILLPLCAAASFLCGVPLGNEGPCVQMGTAVGQGTVRIFGGKKQAWSRYIMTGGACAGFSVATGAPITGIFFAVEEAHRRFSPMLFIVASVSITVSEATMELLGKLTGTSVAMYDFSISTVLPLSALWTAVVVGLLCGICAIFFTRAYRLCSRLVKDILGGLPLPVKFVAIFAIVAVMGFISADFIGSGHSLTEKLLEGGGVWYLLIICFCVRALLLMLANNAGVTGGLFVPTLAFGAIIGALCGKAMVALGLLGGSCYVVLVIVGMSAFLSASSRTPITACVFAIEALSGLENILPIAAAVTVAYLVIECVGVTAFNDTVIDSKAEARYKGKEAKIFDMFLTVQEGAFVVEKEIRDILWPPTCVVLSVEKNPMAKSRVGIAQGDVLHVHYQTFDPDATFEELEKLVGVQSENVRMRVHTGGENHRVPEL